MSDKEQSANGNREDSLGAATRGLATALQELNKVIGQQISGVVPEIQDNLASSLRQASESLNRAAVKAQSGGKAKRPSKVDQTRIDLLEAAGRIFAQKGYEGASMGDIGAEAGFTKGALYAHFKSKADLFHGVVRSIIDTVPDSPIIPGVHGTEIDQEAIADWLHDLATDPRLLLSIEFIAYGIRHPDEKDELTELQRCNMDKFATDIARIRSIRSGKTEIQPPDQGDIDTALLIVSLANQIALQSQLTNDKYCSPENGARLVVSALKQNDR